MVQARSRRRRRRVATPAIAKFRGRTAALPGGLDSLMRIPGSPLIVLSGGLTLVTSPGPALPAPLVQSFPRLLRVVKLSCLL